MPSSPSSLLRFELQQTGEGLNVWGDSVNTALELIEEAVAGVQAKALTGNVTLSSTNYVSNEYRHSVLAFTDGGLSGVPTVTVPAVEKNWIVHNKGATYNVNISCGGTAAAVRPGHITIVYCDGTDCFVSDLTLDKIKAPSASVSLNSQKITNLADGTADTDAVNKLQVTSLTSANVALAQDWASKTSAAVSGGEWSAKAHAIGGTGGPPGGNAKDYATAAAASAATASTDATTATTQAGIATTKAAEAAASAASANLPAITVSDATKLIKVNAGGTGYAVTTTTIDASGKLVTPATATGSAGLNLPHGTAPTSPSDGDVWTTTAGLYARVSGATVGPYAVGAGADIQAFTASGTWTKPAVASSVMVLCIGAGGGGASGRRGAAGTDRRGGGGGGGGGYNLRMFRASDLSATETVTIGAGGTAGAAVTVNSTDGNNGGDGGTTSFGTKNFGYGGGGGVRGNENGNIAGGGGGGVLSSGVGQSGGEPFVGSVNEGFGGGGGRAAAAGYASGFGGGGGGGSAQGVGQGQLGASSAYAGGGGGGGGGITSGDAAGAGRAGGSNTGLNGGGGAAGAVNASGSAGSQLTTYAGAGGGGGGASISGAAGSGGAGGIGGGGGGGGGASLNGNNSGAGGVGGAGYCLVISW